MMLEAAWRARAAGDASRRSRRLRWARKRERSLTPIVAELRRLLDAPTFVDYNDRKLLAHLKIADRNRARYALIVGTEELAAGELVLRDLEHRSDRRLPLGLHESRCGAPRRSWGRDGRALRRGDADAARAAGDHATSTTSRRSRSSSATRSTSFRAGPPEAARGAAFAAAGRGIAQADELRAGRCQRHESPRAADRRLLSRVVARYAPPTSRSATASRPATCSACSKR